MIHFTGPCLEKVQVSDPIITIPKVIKLLSFFHFQNPTHSLTVMIPFILMKPLQSVPGRSNSLLARQFVVICSSKIHPLWQSNNGDFLSLTAFATIFLLIMSNLWKTYTPSSPVE